MRTYGNTEAAQPAVPALFALNPCAMSRGRGGPYKEHYHRHPPPHSKVKENYNRPGPAPLFPRADAQQIPNPNYYNSPVRPVVPIQSPPPLTPSAPPIPNHIKVAPNSVAFNRLHNENHSIGPIPNSFHYKQAEFLRGQSSEAPQFRGSGRGGLPSWTTSSLSQSGYSTYTPPHSTPRGRGTYSQDQSSTCPSGPGASQGISGPQNRLQGRSSQSLSDSFQRLSLSQEKLSQGGKRFDRHSFSSSSENLRYTGGNITLTPDIQDQVYKSLAALTPQESISAKALARKLRLPKKIVNKALYSLERSQKASKQGLLPPEWTLYREPIAVDEGQKSQVQSPFSCFSTKSPEIIKAKVDIETEKKGRCKEEDSDTESTSSCCSSLESFNSEESQSSEKAQHHEKQYPSSSSSPNQQLNFVMMADQKEKILQYLLESGEATALVVAKNIGLKTAKQVNPTLHGLEKQGDVVKRNNVNPPRWELSTHRREKMKRSLKNAHSTAAVVGQMEVEDVTGQEGERSIFLPSSLPSIPGLDTLAAMEDSVPGQSQSDEVG